MTLAALAIAALLAQAGTTVEKHGEMIGPWVQTGAVGVIAWWILTKTLPKVNESADARQSAMLKALDDQRNTSSAAFRALTEDYREEMRLEREAHAKENAEFRQDLRVLADRIEWGANGRDRNSGGGRT